MSTATPSASSTSAEPHCDDCARLPCFTTLTPAPAAISAASVDTLIVPERSPPVPHVSTAPGCTSTGTEYRRIDRTSDASSASVSPFVRRATMKPAACTSATRPSRISASAASMSSSDSSAPRVSRARIGVRTAFTSVPPEVVVEDTASDQTELHLRSALNDRELARVAVVELGEVVLHVTGGSQHLQRLTRHLHRDLRRVVLGHREEGHVLLRVLALVGHHRGPVRQKARGLDLGRELGDL